MAASLVVSLLLYIQIDQPEEVSEPLHRWCELASVGLECAAVPAYWVWETGKASKRPHYKRYSCATSGVQCTISFAMLWNLSG